MKTLLSTVALMMLVACGSTSDPAPITPVADAGTGNDAAVVVDSGGMDAAVEKICVREAALATVAPDVTATKAALTGAPTPAGGTIATGTYTMSSSRFYTDGPMLPAGTSRIQMKLLANNEWVWAYKNNADSDTKAGGTYETSGTTIKFTTTCALGGTPPSTFIGYTAAGNTLTTINDNGQAGNGHVIYTITYTKN